MKFFLFCSLFTGTLLGAAVLVQADDDELNKLKAQVEEQEDRLTVLEQQPSGSGARARGPNALNPEIGMVADIVATSSESEEDEEGNDRISVREIELIIGGDIDPYSRFDSTITYSDFEEVGLEEAYITHWGLPWGIKGRLGRVRLKIGKENALHRDQLETVDYPLVIQEYLGVEGLSRSGLELSRVLPGLAGSLTHEVLVGVAEGGIGEDGTLFGETRRRPTLFAHLRNFWDISHATSLELGGSWMTGSSNDQDDFNVTALGGDITFLHHFDATRRLTLQSEIYWQDRDEAAAVEEEEEEAAAMPTEPAAGEMPVTIPFRDNPYGFYLLGDLRMTARWSGGGRYDWVEPVNLDEGNDEDTAYSAYLTFHQSEFARWRLQYQHVDFAAGESDDRVWVQATIAIGVHKHQLQ